jgi:predicted MFS family arabinose efflux permease
VAAVGLSSMQWNLGRVLGPVAAALAISAGGVTTALLINAGSFFAVVIVLIFVPLTQVLGAPRSIVQSVKDGLAYARETPAVRSMLWLMMGTVLITAPFIGFVSQMATNVFNGNETTTSILITAQGLGAVAAGASLGALTARFGLSRVMIGMISLLVPSLLAYGSAPNVAISAVCLAVVGFAYMGSLSSFMSVSQRLAPPEGRGRAMMANNFVLGLFYPLGLLVQGILADVKGLRWVTVGSGLVLAVAIITARLLRPQHTRPIQVALG